MRTVRTLVRYIQISGLSFVVNVGLTIVLHEVCVLPEELAYAVALVVVFLMNFFAMRHYIYNGTRGTVGRQFAVYTGSAIGFRLSEYVVFLVLHTWLLGDYRMVVIGIATVAASAKFLYYRFVFEGQRGLETETAIATVPGSNDSCR